MHKSVIGCVAIATIIVSAQTFAAGDVSGKAPATADVSSKVPTTADVSGKAPAATDVSGKAPAATDDSGKAPAATDVSGKAPAAAGVSGKTPAGADDAAWIARCINDNAKEKAAPEVVEKYCTCMTDKMDENETRSVSKWEETHPDEMKACEDEAGWE
ncbi:hypothetical protein [uncultured Thiodictyon sp.]|uniref:hypothetical protein n=1 Tax=uncultured Thiodictyon sp. TaxID=1846217 RepID=UPI0025CE4D0D|nr:hypothetical protein [uncultured Thiodictyon sp.]